jgi:hypothetical protein
MEGSYLTHGSANMLDYDMESVDVSVMSWKSLIG